MWWELANMYTKLREAFRALWEEHICAEDPYDRRQRLLAETEKEIKNRTLEILALQEAIQGWALEHEKQSRPS
jgi:hypothetical protein